MVNHSSLISLLNILTCAPISRLYGVAPFITYPPLSYFTTMHSRLVGQDRDFCLGKQAFMPVRQNLHYFGVVSKSFRIENVVKLPLNIIVSVEPINFGFRMYQYMILFCKKLQLPSFNGLDVSRFHRLWWKTINNLNTYN